jgi:hypothetical protein
LKKEEEGNRRRTKLEWPDKRDWKAIWEKGGNGIKTRKG